MAKRRRLKKKVKIALYVLIAIVLSIVIIFSIIKVNKKHNSIEYKLGEIGYSEKEIDTIKKENNDIQNYILENEYNKYYLELISAKYFISANFKDYITYHNKLSDYDTDKLVAYVNTASYKESYEDTVESNTENPLTTLVNKNNFISKDYKPNDLEDVSVMYSYEGRKLSDTAYVPFKEMFNQMSEAGLYPILYRGYRSYSEAEELFETYKSDYGERTADEMLTRAGFSENQLGLSVSILSYYHASDDFETTDEYKWLEENAYKYGFILRYPKNKEYITKYEFDPTYYRYVGEEIALIIHDENLTFEEYVSYYLK